MYRITMSSVPLGVLQAVLTTSAQQRDHVLTNLAAGEAFAPQVHCGGRSPEGEMLYTIVTAPFDEVGALAIMQAAHAAEPEPMPEWEHALRFGDAVTDRT